MTDQAKIWYSFYGGCSVDDAISFYEKGDFPWVVNLENNFVVIQKEIQSYIEQNDDRIKPYFNVNLVTKAKKWRTFAFFFWKWKVKKNMKKCPKTISILQQIPNIVSASVSILEPGVQIKPHRGDTNAIMRLHLSLVSPVGLPECGFSVNGQEKEWKEGEVFIFNDAAKHTAWNNSDQRRYVLLVDVMRNEYAHKMFIVCSTVLSSLIMQSFFQKMPWLKKLPRPINFFMLKVHATWINLALRIK